MGYHGLRLFVQLPVPPPAPPVPPPAAPVPPPAPEPLPLRVPPVPPELPPEESEPLVLLSLLFPPEGVPGLLLGAMVEPPVDPDFVPVASAPSPVAANVAADADAIRAANSNEVILMFIMVRLQKMSRYLMLV
jgi:hypothetical protein